MGRGGRRLRERAATFAAAVSCERRAAGRRMHATRATTARGTQRWLVAVAEAGLCRGCRDGDDWIICRSGLLQAHSLALAFSFPPMSF